MKNITFVMRADDAGSSRSANAAMLRVIRAGFVKNVSVMAPCAYVEEAAELFGTSRRVCFGMHGTLNAEWDRVKWGPVSGAENCPGLVDANGAFLPDPADFETARPAVETVMREFGAQLDRLTRAGFNISYVDTHMLPERHIPGLDEAVREWAKAKGLIDHMFFYQLPAGWEELAAHPEKQDEILKSIPGGQYFFISHPCVYSEESLLMGNARYPGESVARGRDGEAKLFGSGLTKTVMRLRYGIKTIRYDQAAPGRRITVDEVKKMYGG